MSFMAPLTRERAEVPGYALMPDGRPSGTTYFYKHVT